MNAEIISRLDASFAPLPLPVSQAIERAYEAIASLEETRKKTEESAKETEQMMISNLEKTFKEVESLAAELRSKLRNIDPA
jgi:hypothetical protein